MQFSAKKLQNNRLAHPLWELAHPLEYPGSATALALECETTGIPTTPTRFNILHLHAVFRKLWPKNRLAPSSFLINWLPLWEIMNPPRTFICGSKGILGPISFISMQFSAKILPNNRSPPKKFGIGAPNICYFDCSSVQPTRTFIDDREYRATMAEENLIGC